MRFPHPNMECVEVCDVKKFYTITTICLVPKPLWNSDNQKFSNFKKDFFYCSVILPFAVQLFLLLFGSIAQGKIAVLVTPVTSSNLRNQAPLFTELRLLQGTSEILVKKDCTSTVTGEVI